MIVQINDRLGEFVGRKGFRGGHFAGGVSKRMASMGVPDAAAIQEVDATFQGGHRTPLAAGIRTILAVSGIRKTRLLAVDKKSSAPGCAEQMGDRAQEAYSRIRMFRNWTTLN